jgi:hypothetical protein
MSPLPSVVLALALANPTPPAAPTGDAPRLEDLVRKLGDKSFRVREDAARELLRKGSAAVAALTAGMKDADLEVAERCRQILPHAAAKERNEKLDLLVNNPTAPPPTGLSGLTRFLQMAGDDKSARELYAEAMRMHHRTIEAAEKDPRAAAQQYREFCEDIYNRWQNGARLGRYSYDNIFSSRADITFFLFLTADARVRRHESGNNWAYVLLNGSQISTAIAEKDGSPAMRKLFLNWLENESQSYMQQYGFQLAAKAQLKEALPVLLKILAKKDRDKYSQVQVMTALIKLGGKEHIKVLDPFLSDKQEITTINFGNGQMLKVQTRDVAMAVQIRLAGQKLQDFGYDNRFGGGGDLSYHYYGFPTDEARDTAHTKWKEWVAKNKPADAKDADKKESEKKSAAPKPPEKK